MPKLYARFLTWVLLMLSMRAGGLAQDPPQNTGRALLTTFSYGWQIPGGDLSERYGDNFSLGLQTDFLTANSQWLFGLSGQFLFGSNVKTDVLSGLRTPEGFIIGNDRQPASIQLRERGFYLGVEGGRLFALSSDNPRSALRLTLGGGLLQHQIRLQNDPLRSVPQIEGPYEKGYDRLTNGLALRQYIGYQLLGTDRRANFSVGIECMQGFTRNRRIFNFDTRRRENETRLDLLFGIRLGWILPFYFD